jgi:hypothetical protein
MKKREIDFAFGSNLIASVVFEQESSKRLLKNEHAQILYCQLEIEKGGWGFQGFFFGGGGCFE